MTFPVDAWVYNNKFMYLNGWVLTSGPWWSHLMREQHKTGSASVIIYYPIPGPVPDDSPIMHTGYVTWHRVHITDGDRDAIGWVCDDGQFLPSSLAGHRRTFEPSLDVIPPDPPLPPGITGREPGLSKKRRLHY